MQTRRDAINQSACVAAMLATVGMLPSLAQAQAGVYNSVAFEARTMTDLGKALGASAPVQSKDVSITGPDIAENGALVPVGASSSLPGIRRLLILVEKNPSLMAAMFELSDAVEANVSTRVKMEQSSNVYAVAMMADGRMLFARREVKVTLGGCGV